MMKRVAGDKRHRRERGSIKPDDIMDGALKLVEETSLDNLSMTVLADRLGVGVTSIYWYFHRKDDLLVAMTSRALGKYVFPAPCVDATQWRESLAHHARTTRRIFVGNPVLTDLVLIRGTLGAAERQRGIEQMEQAIASLTEAGLTHEEAARTISAVTMHVRASVVLERLHDIMQALEVDNRGESDSDTVNSDGTPEEAQSCPTGRRVGMADADTFEFGLASILGHAQQLIDERAAMPEAVDCRSIEHAADPAVSATTAGRSAARPG